MNNIGLSELINYIFSLNASFKKLQKQISIHMNMDADLVLMLKCYLGHVDYLGYLYMKINGTDIYHKSVKESKSSMINKQKTSNLDRSIHLCISPRSFLLFLKIKQWQKVE